MTARKVANTTGLPLADINTALSAMADAGTATATPDDDNPTRRTADRWTVTTDTPTDPNPTDTTPPATDDDVSAAPTDGAPSGADGISADEAPAPVAVPFPQPGNADHMKIAMVAGLLPDTADGAGVGAGVVAAESGLRAAIVGKVLAAMETVGAAVRTAGPDGEVWSRGAGDLAAVSLANVPTNLIECPQCAHRFVPPARNRRTGGGAPGVNGDGGRVLGKNELRDMVREFLDQHAGHEFGANTIATELGRSSGAVGNALAKLVTSGHAILTNDAPMRYTTAKTPQNGDN
ncbi:MarR family transcriptional regulator [Pilimelia terevasa]|nr:MarR family transcriptional regulator [Pilimelia terevasa]